MYNSDQKLVFRKDYIPGQNGDPVAMAMSSGYLCDTMESMSMSVIPSGLVIPSGTVVSIIQEADRWFRFF